jgi:hypothetical protein
MEHFNYAFKVLMIPFLLAILNSPTFKGFKTGAIERCEVNPDEIRRCPVIGNLVKFAESS